MRENIAGSGPAYVDVPSCPLLSVMKLGGPVQLLDLFPSGVLFLSSRQGGYCTMLA
jgi:hypothetical protein